MKRLMMTAALALLAAPALADNGPETKWKWGCEWQKADNGNYFFKVDGGCKHWIGMGYSNMADYNGDTKVRPDFGDDEDEDEDEDEDDGGEGPGDEGPGDDGGEGPGDEGPGKPGKDKPGKRA